jgi:hypothetical protein
LTGLLLMVNLHGRKHNFSNYSMIKVFCSVQRLKLIRVHARILNKDPYTAYELYLFLVLASRASLAAFFNCSRVSFRGFLRLR